MRLGDSIEEMSSCRTRKDGRDSVVDQWKG